MMPTNITWRVMACILGLALGSFAAIAAPPQTADWACFLRAGLKAAAAGRYDEAEKDLRASLQEAEKSGPDGLRLPESLHALVGMYSNQGKYAQAEPLAIRLVAVQTDRGRRCREERKRKRKTLLGEKKEVS